MQNRTVVALIATVALSLAAATGCTQLKARDRLNQGVRAFKSAKYAEAVEHFKVATDLDPNFPTARLYLASAYMSQYIPGAESKENLDMAKAAYDEFEKVLQQDPNNSLAIASIATLFFHQKKWEDAEKWNHRRATADPKAKEGFYTLGVIAWTKSFQKRMLDRLGLRRKGNPAWPGERASVLDGDDRRAKRADVGGGNGSGNGCRLPDGRLTDRW